MRAGTDDLALVTVNPRLVADNVSGGAASVSVNSSQSGAEYRAGAPMISSRYSYRPCYHANV
jgi:hypothetical protein